jgi:hypothetical protein
VEIDREYGHTLDSVELEARWVEKYKLTPATTTGRGTNSDPIFLSEAVNQAVKIPPSLEGEKKAVCRLGINPITTPTTAPSNGAFKKSQRKSNHHLVVS